MDQCPPSLLALAKRVGLDIVYDDLSPNIGGALDTSTYPRFILINRNHHPLDQEFSIAHEIGHYQMRHHRTISCLLPADMEADGHAYGLLWHAERYRAIGRALLRKPWQLLLAVICIATISFLAVIMEIPNKPTTTSEAQHEQ